MLNKKITLAFTSISAFIILSAATLQQVPTQGTPGQTPPAQGAPAQGQGFPQKYTNLKVISKKVDPQELQRIMRNYNASLGVNCGYCHASQPNNPNARDYASDAKPEKETARGMIKMKDRINKKYFANGGGAAIVAIDCYTCHQGKKEPVNVAPARPPGAAPGNPPGPGQGAAPAKG